MVVLNGDCFELLAGRRRSVAAALDEHPVFEAALTALRTGGGRLVVTVGNHDGRLAWDTVEAHAATDRLGAELCFAADLIIETARGDRVVRVEHGHRFDAANSFRDPRNPLDSPLGHHIVEEVLPELEGRPFLRDVARLADPNEFSRFLGSRVVYRQLMRRWWLLLVPIVVGLAARTPFVVRALSTHRTVGHVERWLLVASIGLVADVLVLGIVAVLVVRRVFSALAGSRLGPRGSHLNELPRTAAEALCSEGFAGFVTGHTHHPELWPIAGGFYANSGCGVLTIESWAARWGLPPVFAGVHRRSWIEIGGDRDMSTQLWLSESAVDDQTRLERLAVRRHRPRPAVPTVVADVPTGAAWPTSYTTTLSAPRVRDRARRVGAVATLLVAAVGLVSSLTPPLRARLQWLAQALPVEFPQVASSGLVFTSVALALVARGLRRGLWTAWAATSVLLGVSALLNVTKGADFEEAAIAAAVLGALLVSRRHFQVRSDTARMRRAALIGSVGAIATAAVSALLVTVVGARRNVDRRETLTTAIERLIGGRGEQLPTVSPFVGPAVSAAAIALVVAVLWIVFSPGNPVRPTPQEHHADRERARRVVAQYGGDTLGYFALRDDKMWFFTGRSVVAYAVRNGVCLVSPDPIGPPEDRADVWSEFSTFADGRGWSIAVVAAQPAWRPIYEATGLRSVYMGDEAIVDCQSFTLDGGPMKSVRGAYNRVAKAGYSVEFLDPAHLADATVEELRDVMTQTRQGDAERGFSMTLSRVFDPDDAGLLIAVARNPDGRADAFCHFTPAADIDGWSLDLMRRRSSTEIPNGLTDFVIIETIRHIHATHHWGLGLNFAVMRAVLAGERHGAISQLERKVLHKFSESMQIESLWRYNEKFRPYWRPRNVMLSGPEHAAAQGIAIADAEGIAELPIIGRFLGRRS